MNIGLVQTSAQTADFPNNLRSLVQGYRGCLDQGAELVVADAFSLCGPPPQDFARRASYVRQVQDALNVLSHEIANVPLVTAAWVPSWAEEDELPADESDVAERSHSVLMPHLIEKDTVTLLDPEVVELENGAIIFASCDETLPALPGKCDLAILLPVAPWHIASADRWERNVSWEALFENTPVACLHPCGAAEGFIWGGSSTLHSSQGVLLERLPQFEKAFRVVDVNTKSIAPALPSVSDTLLSALKKGIGDHVLRNGYTEAALLLDDRPASILLAWLTAETLGKENIALFPCGSVSDLVADALRAMGVETRLVPSLPCLADAPSEEFVGLSMAHMILTGEKDGLFTLSSLTRSGVLSGGDGHDRARGARLMPFGDLYAADMALIRDAFLEKYSEFSELFADDEPSVCDAAFQLLEETNHSASVLLSNPDFRLVDEATLRKAQRLLIASAWGRKSLPPYLHVGDERTRPHYPSMYRLND